MKRFTCITLFVVTLMLDASFANAPQYVNYQGTLASPDGTPLDTTVAVTVSIYNSPSGGGPLWSSTFEAVTVTDGQFTVLLGSQEPLLGLFLAPTRWLGVTIGNNTEMTPRQVMVSVPYAYRVGSIDTTSGGTVFGNVTVSGGNLQVSGKLNVGSGNTNTGSFANVLGQDNLSSGLNAVVGGGRNSKARGSYSVVAGGGGAAPDDSNSASGDYSAIGGGARNFASGAGSTVPGGLNNTAQGTNSFASGRSAYAFHDGCFVWGDNNSAVVQSYDLNMFMARATGGFHLFTNTALNAGALLLPGGGAWSTFSDSTKKRNARVVDTKSILEKVRSLPIKQWSYNSQNPSFEHVGPMAQDFYAAFGLGECDTLISTIDPDGIALAAIQELAKRLEAVEAENMTLRSRLQTLEASDKQSLNKPTE
ncbi:tail fiber domain-containing protein [candidate division KSB1 bacterium]|nr:tail fiber domain-containing protein [candidate division KSB1 bacterium]